VYTPCYDRGGLVKIIIKLGQNPHDYPGNVDEYVAAVQLCLQVIAFFLSRIQVIAFFSQLVQVMTSYF
jgi:hypothetical protein